MDSLLPVSYEALEVPPARDRNPQCLVYTFGLANDVSFEQAMNSFGEDLVTRVNLDGEP